MVLMRKGTERNSIFSIIFSANRLLSIPMIAASLPCSQKRSIHVLRSLLNPSSHISLADSVASALGVAPMTDIPFPGILSEAESIVSVMSASKPFVMGIQDNLSGVRQVLSKGLQEDALWQCYVIVTAMARNAAHVPPSEKRRLEQLNNQLCRYIRIETWDDIARTLALSDIAVSGMTAYCREAIVSLS